MNIGIVGLGFVGLTLGIALAKGKAKVYGVEINEKIKECLAKNKAHFFEPGLDDLIKSHNNKDFFAVDKFPADIKFDAFIITVGTPLKKDSSEPNFDYIKQALKTISEVYDNSAVVILRSTVSVGTSRNTVIPLLKELTDSKNDVFVAMCPERTVEGKAIEELVELPQIISGNNALAIEKAKAVFSHVAKRIIVANSLEEAELAKLYCNTYRDIVFSIGSAFSMAAQNFGVDGVSVINIANDGYKRANIAAPGFVAGPCLEKDAYLLTNNMENSVYRDFLLEGRVINDALENSVVTWVQMNAGDNKNITISGMAFKGYPETSDLRGSSSVRIAQKLKSLGFKLYLHDFVASINEMDELNLGKGFSDLDMAISADTSVLLILNNHPKYEELDIKEDIKIFDAWSAVKKLRGKKDVYTFGNIFMEER